MEFKPCLLSHHCTPGQSLREECVNVAFGNCWTQLSHFRSQKGVVGGVYKASQPSDKHFSWSILAPLGWYQVNRSDASKNTMKLLRWHSGGNKYRIIWQKVHLNFYCSAVQCHPTKHCVDWWKPKTWISCVGYHCAYSSQPSRLRSFKDI